MLKVRRYVNWNGFKAYSDNLPEQRAGAYQITNLVNGKVYIGIGLDVLKRTKVHARAASRRADQPSRKLNKFAKALRKYDAGSFLIEPVLYSLVPLYDWGEKSTWLRVVEADLVATHDSIEGGYNTLANWYGGPFGPAFGELIRRASLIYWASLSPEARIERGKVSGAATKAVHADPIRGPAIRARMSEKAKARIRTPEFEALRLAGVRSAESRAKRSAALMGRPSPKKGKPANLSPEMRIRIGSGNRGKPSPNRGKKYGEWTEERHLKQPKKMWITNGNEARYVGVSEDIPNGWHQGRLATRTSEQASLSALRTWADPSAREKILRSRVRDLWITDGFTEKRIEKGSQIPSGYRLGRNRTWPAWNKGILQSEAVKAAVSASLKGRSLTEEHKLVVSRGMTIPRTAQRQAGL